MLAEAGARLDAQDFLGTTAAMRAAIGGHVECLRVLKERRVRSSWAASSTPPPRLLFFHIFHIIIFFIFFTVWGLALGSFD